MDIAFSNVRIGIIGLGYVGLPLALEFSKYYKTIGYDISTDRISELKNGIDKTKEVDITNLGPNFHLSFTHTISDLAMCNVFIITVPTPIDQYKKPNLFPLLDASSKVGGILKKDDIVIYESTVYPGCTEEDCVPILENESQLIFNTDFFCGYSPERINPGDKINTLTKIKKVTSGSNSKTASFVDNLYQTIIDAGTHLAPSIKVAEASKAIENAQRDINISFVNELSLIFDRMNIKTSEVLEAAGTKWNFLNFKPGLVGGHCIGVDPYYLTYKAESLGYLPQVISSGRRVNDQMGVFVANKLIKMLIKNGFTIKGSKVLILGFTFKENCPDIRNTRVFDVYKELQEFGTVVDIYDPWASKKEVLTEYGIELKEDIEDTYDALVIAVAHQEFASINIDSLIEPNSIIIDLKSFLPNGIAHWSL